MINIKSDFPIFNEYPNLIYLDNASTTHKPKILLEALNEYYTKYNSNIGRGLYKLAEYSQTAYDESRKFIANFFKSNIQNIIFTNGATDGLNQVSFLVKEKIPFNSSVVLSIYEHHSNLIIWQRLAKEKNLNLIFLKNLEELNNPDIINEDFFNNVSLIALTHVSNVSGQIFPIKKWIDICKRRNIISVIDGSQGITSELINLNILNPDFYVFSTHKFYGPMGLGILYIGDNFLHNEPYKLGGGIVEDVNENYFELINDSSRFEAGTPNVANIYSFFKVLQYLNNNNYPELIEKTHHLSKILKEELIKLDFIELIKTNNNYGNLVSFNINSVHPHDVGTFLSNKNIALRVGKHCAYPLHEHLKLSSSIRASFGIYNDLNDVNIFIEEIKKCNIYFNRI